MSITKSSDGYLYGNSSDMSSRSNRSVLHFAIAFLWGLAEATFFFIVPDVFLTVVARRALKPALKATLAALGGALLGGVLMYALGRRHATTIEAFLDRVPSISPETIARVAEQIREKGSMAILFGPLMGIPYKIYAVEWGAQERSVVTFVLISVPARYVRFFLVT